MAVEPIPGHPAAVADVDGDRALVVADYHAGIEDAIRYEQGVELDSRARTRRETLLELVAETGVEQVIFLGDLMHSIGGPGGAERGEIEVLLEKLAERGVSATVVKGNHDGEIEEFVDVPVTPGDGIRLGSVGFVHGHTWPSREVLEASVICIGHEHPAVRLEDAVGGSRIERVWLRGSGVERPGTHRLSRVQRSRGWDVDQRRGAGIPDAVSPRIADRWRSVPARRDSTGGLPDGLTRFRGETRPPTAPPSPRRASR